MPSDVSSLAFCCSTTRAEIILHSLTARPAGMGGAGAGWGQSASPHKKPINYAGARVCVLTDIQENPKQRCQRIRTRNNSSRSAWVSWWTCWQGILWKPKVWTSHSPVTIWGSLYFPDYQKIQGYNWGNDHSMLACSFLCLTTFYWLGTGPVDILPVSTAAGIEMIGWKALASSPRWRQTDWVS